MKFKFEVGQKVRILDGSKISDYVCGWNQRMIYDVGKIVTITEQIDNHRDPAYRVAETEWSYDERGLVDASSKNGIKKIILNDPATIILWTDGSKTVVKAHNEDFDAEKGIAMCFMKKALGNKGSFNNVFKKWIPAEKETTPSPTPSAYHKDVEWEVLRSPSQSGWYIGITKSGLETDLHYSTVHKAWNVFDEQDEEFADRYHIDIFAWRPMTHAEL